MIKSMKKLTAMLLALLVAVAMAIPVFAEGNNFTITAPDNGHTYEVYQIFTGDYSGGVLSNAKWGKNGTGTQGEAVESAVITELTSTTGSDTEKLEVISKYVNLESAAFGTIESAGRTLTVPGGYYLIKDKDGSLEDENDSYTLYIVEVAGDVTIAPKADVPKFEKKVQDINDSTDSAVSDWQDSADHDIGDKVNFKLSGTVAANYDAYEKYQFTFHDVESQGLTFNKDSVIVKVDGNKITEGYEVVTEGLADGCTFEVRFADLKEITEVKAKSVITVEYQSTLNEDAVIGSAGNPNRAELEFSNNPNDTQGGETGRTPEDTVIVFTYKTVIDKVDGTQKPLTGAAFKLEKKIKNTAGGEDTWELVKEYKADQTTTQFQFTGLDDGTYRLTETETPEGYNTIAPIEFTVTAQHDILSDNPALTSLSGNAVTGEITFTSNAGEGSLTAKVVNQTGAELPETGGMGTRVFYIVGSILAVGAGILLISRKRMNMTEKK